MDQKAKEEYLKRLKDEIQKDPKGRGYAGKTPKEIADLINGPIIIKEDITYHNPPPQPKEGDKIGEKIVENEIRAFHIVGGIPDGPNAIEPSDVMEALQ